MTVNADRWRERGRHVRAVESMHGTPHVTSRERAREAMRVTFTVLLAPLTAPEREEAIEHAAEGYLTEHVARGGTLA